MGINSTNTLENLFELPLYTIHLHLSMAMFYRSRVLAFEFILIIIGVLYCI